MTSRQGLFQTLISDLVILYADAILKEGRGSIELSDVQELSLSRAIDTAFYVIFRKLGIPTKKKSRKLSSLAVKHFERAIESDQSLLADNASMAAEFGSALESLRGKQIRFTRSGKIVFESSPDRREKGIYFTPPELAEAAISPALQQALKNVQTVGDLRKVAIVDPAVGGGAFLLAAVRVGSILLAGRVGFRDLSTQQIRTEIVAHCIFGVDIDPLAIAVTRMLLRIQIGNATRAQQQLDRHLRVGDSVSATMEDWAGWFPEVFPGGFHLVATNPPWSKLRPLRQEFFEHLDRRVRLHQGTELGIYLKDHLDDLIRGKWTDYVARTKRLSEQLKTSSDYSLANDGGGDPDLYKYFTERALRLLSANGAAAMLLPSGILRAQGSAGLRKALLSEGRVFGLTEYINKKKIFPIHSMYRFCAVSFQKNPVSTGGIRAEFRKQQLQPSQSSDEIILKSNFLRKVGGSDRLVPEVKSTAEKKLLEKLFGQFSLARSGHQDWNLSFRRELDMTNDADAFISLERAQQEGYKAGTDGRWTAPRSDSRLLPVYEGRMVHQFDSIAKIYLSGQGRSAKWSVPTGSERTLIPHYFVLENYARKRGWRPAPRAAYCEISGHANERTLLAALLPPHCICGNKVPVLQLESGTESDQLLWLALANSLVVDWLMRRFVSTTVNHFFWHNIPLPPRASTSVVAMKLITAASKLSIPYDASEDYLTWLGRKAILRAAIDALVLDLYGVSEAEFMLLLEDFPRVKNAHSMGPDGSVRLANLVRTVGLACKTGTSVEDLVFATECPLRLAAAAYMPREQAKRIFAPGAPGTEAPMKWPQQRELTAD